MKKKLFLLSTALFTLTACDKEKTPLTGTREAFTTLDSSIRQDNSIKRGITFPQALKNKNWSQVGGNTEHNLPNLSLATDLKQHFVADIGVGNSSDQFLTSNLIVHENVAYTFDAHGMIRGFNIQTGDKVFEYETLADREQDQALGGGISAHAGVIYATTSFGDVLAITIKTGKLLWKSRTQTPVRVAPTVRDGRVFVQTVSNDLHVFNAENGAELWNHSGITESAKLMGAATPSVNADTVLAAYSSGEIYALNVRDGMPAWTDTITSAARIDTVASMPHIKARPILDQKNVYAISHGGKMISVNLQTGMRNWERDFSGIRTPALVGDFLFVLTITNEILAIEKNTGKVKWISALSFGKKDEKITWAGPVAVNNQLVFYGSNGDIAFIDAKTGKLLNTIKTDHETFFSPVVAQDKLFMLTTAGKLVAFSN